jgi:hypothetical protein
LDSARFRRRASRLATTPPLITGISLGSTLVILCK